MKDIISAYHNKDEQLVVELLKKVTKKEMLEFAKTEISKDISKNLTKIEILKIISSLYDDGLEVEILEEPEVETIPVSELRDKFTEVQQNAYEISQKLAEDISMLELDETKTMIENAIIELEGFAGANQSLNIGFMNKIGNSLMTLPGGKKIGSLIAGVKEEAQKQNIASSNIKEAAERLFNTLENKQKILEKTTLSVMEIEARRKEDLKTLAELENSLQEIILSESNQIEVFQAKNTLISIKEAIIQSSGKIEQVNVIIEAAQSSSFAITTLLPKIKNNFLDDLTIASGLNHLIQYKEMFDSTIKLVNDIEEHNFRKINRAMLDAVELNINTTQTDRLTKLSEERLKAKDALIKKTKEQMIAQTRSLNSLNKIQKKIGSLSISTPKTIPGDN